MQTMQLNLTLVSLYQYMYARDGEDTLFKDLNVPEGYDKQTLIDTILLKADNYELIYPDGDFMAFAIKNWSARHQDVMTRLYNALHKTYDPIENYNRFEEYTDNGSGSNTGESTGADTHSVSGYDVSNFSPESMDSSLSDSSSSYENTLTHDSHIHGNIGVTTSQQMIQAEVNLYKDNEQYEIIATLFCKEFVIPVT